MTVTEFLEPFLILRLSTLAISTFALDLKVLRYLVREKRWVGLIVGTLPCTTNQTPYISRPNMPKPYKPPTLKQHCPGVPSLYVDDSGRSSQSSQAFPDNSTFEVFLGCPSSSSLRRTNWHLFRYHDLFISLGYFPHIFPGPMLDLYQRPV